MTSNFKFNPFTRKLDYVGTGGGPPPPNSVSMRPYIVGPTNSDYTTIQSAINAAVTAGAGENNWAYILVKSNNAPYIEDIVLADGIYVYANATAGNDQWSETPKPVILQGSVTLSSGRAMISGINVSPTASSAFILSACTLYMSYCSALNYSFAGPYISVTGADGINLICNNNSLYNTNAGSSYIGINSTGTNIIYDSSSAVLFSTTASTLAGNGSVNWQVSNCTYAFSNDVTCNTLNYVASGSKFVANSPQTTFMSTGASTEGSMFISHCSFIAFDISVDLLTIGNANFTPALQFCAFDRPYSYTLASDQVQNASLFLIDAGVSGDQGLIFADAKTGFRDSRYIQKQAFFHTTDATTQTLLQVDLEEGESVIIEGVVNGYADFHTQGQSQGGNFLIFANRQSGGNVTIDGSNVNNLVASTAAFAVFANIPNQSIDIVVNGINPPAIDMSWSCTYQYMKMKNEN